MKRIISTLMILCLIFSAAACSTSQPDEDEKTYDSAPVIVINGNEYFADIVSIVNELPDGYEYGGKLTEERSIILLSIEKIFMIFMFIRNAGLL